MKKLNYVFVFALVIGFNILVRAQLSGTVGYSYFYDDNPLRTKIGENEFVNTVKSDLSYRFFDKELYLNYSGNFNSFKTIGDRTYQLHAFGLNYAFKSGDQEDENIFTGLSYSLKKGTGDFSAYNYTQIGGFLNGKFALGETSFILGAFNSNYKKFPSLSSLIHFENFLSTQFSTFFSSGTGVFLEVGAGIMDYSYEFVSMPSMAGNGKGKMMGRTASVTTEKFSVTQVRSMIKVSQSIFEGTGINFHFLYRTNLKENKGMFQSADYIYSGDDELWDDPYGFHSNEIGSEFTQKIPYDMLLKISAEYSTRHYTNNLADSLNLIQRVDQRFGMWAGISKVFNEIPFINSVELSLEYMLINNKSNMSSFEYKNNLLLFGVQVGF